MSLLRMQIAKFYFSAQLTVLVLGMSSVCRADEFTSLSAHQHGHGILSLAVDRDQLFIEFTAPAINLLGVEHRPTEPAAIAQLQAKAAHLKTLQWLTLAASANCQVQSVDVFSTILDAEHSDKISRDAQQITDALWQNGQTAGKSAEEHKHAAEHSDVLVSASFRCTNAAELSEATFSLWGNSLALNEISAQWILPSGQGAATLTQSNPTIKF